VTGGGGLLSAGYNIIGNNADALINSEVTEQIGTLAAPIDPLLGPLADNGGITLTHALQAGSPAIDHGVLLRHPKSSAAIDGRAFRILAHLSLGSSHNSRQC